MNNIPQSKLTISVQAAIALFIAALFIVSPFLNIEWLWGINHLKFHSTASLVILIAVVVIPGIVLFRKRQADISQSNLPDFETGNIQILITGLLSGILFYLLKPHYPFLGDGVLRSGEIAFVKTISSTEPLTTITAKFLYMTIGGVLGLGADKIFSLISAFSGAVLVIFLLCYFRNDERRVNLIPLLFMASLGTTALFCGYVETYSIPAMLTIVFVLSSFKGIHHSRWRMVAIAAGSLSMISHLMGLIFLPAILYLLLTGWNREDTGRYRLLSVMTFLACIIPLFYFAFVYESAGSAVKIDNLFVSFDPTNSYFVFSAAHLLDILNELLLVIPAALVLIPVLLLDRKQNQLGSGMLPLALLIMVPSFLFLFLFDPKLGMARDWDLFAIPVVSIALLILAVRLSINRNWSLIEKAGILVGIAIISSFILVNCFPGSSTERFESLLKLDPERSPSGREVLANYYMSRGQPEEAAGQYREALAVEKNRRYYKLLSETLLQLGRAEEAAKEAFRAVRLDSEYSEGHHQLGQSLEQMGADSSAMHHYYRAVELAPEVGRYRNSLGTLALKLGENKIAEENLFEAVKLNPESAIYYNNLGTVKLALGKPLEAKPCFEKALKLENNFYLAMFNLARVLKATERYSEAETYFQRILNEAPSSDLAERVRSLRDTLK